MFPLNWFAFKPFKCVPLLFKTQWKIYIPDLILVFAWFFVAYAAFEYFCIELNLNATIICFAHHLSVRLCVMVCAAYCIPLKLMYMYHKDDGCCLFLCLHRLYRPLPLADVPSIHMRLYIHQLLMMYQQKMAAPKRDDLLPTFSPKGAVFGKTWERDV